MTKLIATVSLLFSICTIPQTDSKIYDIINAVSEERI